MQATPVRCNNPRMQVKLYLSTGCQSTAMYLLASEARQLAQELLQAADQYEQAKPAAPAADSQEGAK